MFIGRDVKIRGNRMQSGRTTPDQSGVGEVFWSYQTEQTESIESKDKVW